MRHPRAGVSLLCFHSAWTSGFLLKSASFCTTAWILFKLCALTSFNWCLSSRQGTILLVANSGRVSSPFEPLSASEGGRGERYGWVQDNSPAQLRRTEPLGSQPGVGDGTFPWSHHCLISFGLGLRLRQLVVSGNLWVGFWAPSSLVRSTLGPPCPRLLEAANE